jgi:hypothetical protein
MYNAMDIARALGGSGRLGGWYRVRCPVHASRGPTLALRDGAGGLVVHCHAGCASPDVLAELRRIGLLDGEAGDFGARPDDAQIARRRDADARERRRKIAFAMGIWGASYPAAGTVVERYLLSRGLTLPPPPTLRYHPMHGSYGRHPSGAHRPQMIGLVLHQRHGLVGVARTFLEPNGSAKATLDPPRLFVGPVGGGAVRLATPGPALLVGEGIETALSGMAATRIPAWAALSTSGLELLQLPVIVRSITILVDHDRNGAGERAARTAGARWLAEGRRVRLAIPPEPGSDWNDVYRGRRL